MEFLQIFLFLIGVTVNSGQFVNFLPSIEKYLPDVVEKIAQILVENANLPGQIGKLFG